MTENAFKLPSNNTGIRLPITYYKSCSKSKEAISICTIDNETKKI